MKTYAWMVYWILWSAIFLVLGGVSWRMTQAQAQEKPAPAKAEPSKPTEPPAMSTETGIKLRDAVLAQAKLVIQLKDTITTYNNLQGALNAQAKAVDDLKTAVLKDAKLDPEKWDVDLDKFVFIARAVPAKADKKP
jgi:hypothetical protein